MRVADDSFFIGNLEKGGHSRGRGGGFLDRLGGRVDEIIMRDDKD